MGSTQMWALAKIAYTRTCPTCGAEPEQRCRNLRASRGRYDIAQPHAARYPGGNRLIGDPVNAAALVAHPSHVHAEPRTIGGSSGLVYCKACGSLLYSPAGPGRGRRGRLS